MYHSPTFEAVDELSLEISVISLEVGPGLVVWRPVRLGWRGLPTTRRGEVGKYLNGSSDDRPAVIRTVKQIPAPERHRWSDRPARQCRRHRRCVALWRLEYWTLQAGHVVKEGWPSDAPVIDVDHGRLIRFGEGGGVAVPRSPGCVIDVDEYRHFVRRHAFGTSRAMGARQDRLQFLVPQEVSRQVEPFHVGCRNPGNCQVEASFGDPFCLGV